jgi:hypothetical protein
MHADVLHWDTMRRLHRVRRLWCGARFVRKKVVTTSMQYDNDGNLIQKTTDGVTTTYVYDYANRLIGLGVSGATTTYGYDAFGSRVLQTTATTTNFYPFMWYNVASSTGTGAKYSTTTEYIWSPKGDTLVSTVDQQFANGVATGSARTLYIHPDHLGSTNVVTNASGTVVQTLDYYPYGGVRINSSTGGADSARKYINRFADQSGAPVRRYNVAIGYAAQALPAGSWVNEQRLVMPAPPALEGLPIATSNTPLVPALEGYTFEGYRNPDRSVGMRNILGKPRRCNACPVLSSTPCGGSAPRCCPSTLMSRKSSQHHEERVAQ